MNEENCIEFIKEQFKGVNEELLGIDERKELYGRCRDYCKQEGIKGVQFDMLWNRAMFQIKAGI